MRKQSVLLSAFLLMVTINVVDLVVAGFLGGKAIVIIFCWLAVSFSWIVVFDSFIDISRSCRIEFAITAGFKKFHELFEVNVGSPHYLELSEDGLDCSVFSLLVGKVNIWVVRVLEYGIYINIDWLVECA